MNYPGRTIKAGEQNGDIVKSIKRQLNALLALGVHSPSWLNPEDPVFGIEMRQTVKLFQSRHVDHTGVPLQPDGIVGPLTWAALFGPDSVYRANATTGALLMEVMAIASGEMEKGVRERPKNSNRGPEVDEYLRRAGVQPPDMWCCAFVYWCFDEAANKLGRDNPMVKTAGCLDHWRRSAGRGANRVSASDAISNPALIKPGAIFIMDYSGGKGHTGIVTEIHGGVLTTIEGNTDGSLTRDGGGVYRLKRKMSNVNKGYIDYAGL